MFLLFPWGRGSLPARVILAGFAGRILRGHTLSISRPIDSPGHIGDNIPLDDSHGPSLTICWRGKALKGKQPFSGPYISSLKLVFLNLFTSLILPGTSQTRMPEPGVNPNDLIMSLPCTVFSNQFGCTEFAMPLLFPLLLYYLKTDKKTLPLNHKARKYSLYSKPLK